MYVLYYKEEHLFVRYFGDQWIYIGDVAFFGDALQKPDEFEM